MGAVSNSFILFGLLCALAGWRKWPILTVFGLAALLHLLLDFPLHADDAHRHFWPVSDWRFQSPVSYWDPAFNGWLGVTIETIVTLAATAILWMRFSRVRWRLLFGVLALRQTLAFVAQFALSVGG